MQARKPAVLAAVARSPAGQSLRPLPLALWVLPLP